MEVDGQRHVPAALRPEMTRYVLHKRLGRPQGRSGRVLKTSPPPGFDPRTVPTTLFRPTPCEERREFYVVLCLITATNTYLERNYQVKIGRVS